MKKFFAWFFKNFEKIYITSLFVVSCAIVILLFPGEGKFRYEFQKGQPWLHEDLIAPFNFAVLKMEEELALEQEEVKANFTPYFVMKKEVGEKQLDNFKTSFENNWNLWKTKHDSLQSLGLAMDTIIYEQDSVQKYFLATLTMLKNIYKQGIIEFHDDIVYNNQTPDAIQVIEDNVAKEIGFSSVFTLKSAYTFLIQNLNKYNFNDGTNHNLEFLKNLKFSNFIEPTLFYDQETSEKVKKDLTESISLTKGMIQEGERVISRGEMIDTDKFRALESLKKEYLLSLNVTANRSIMFAGRFLLVLFAFISTYVFLFQHRPDFLKSRRKSFFILLLMVVSIVIAKFVYKINILNIYIVPFAILPILIKTFFDSRLALYIHLITIILAAFFAPNSFEFVFIHLMAGVVAMLSLRKIQKRGQFFSATALTMLSYFILFFAVSINQEGDIIHIEWINFAWFAGNGILLFLSFPLVYLFEKTFKFTSDMTLMELSDTNQDLLRKLAEKAPGTFQHSLQVANLSEAVVRKIGGNTLLMRTGALYHDIGKLSKPEYFTENQISGMNPHDKLDYLESAEIIIGHVTIGLEMAKKAKLPSPIIDFIQTHHGTTKVQYFYRLYKKENEDAEEQIEKFTYPGPKPFSKETAVLMMADSIEAASRSLKEYSYETIEKLVEGIINYQINEGQFDNANITFKDITDAKSILKSKLQNIYHARIAYPKEE